MGLPGVPTSQGCPLCPLSSPQQSPAQPESRVWERLCHSQGSWLGAATGASSGPCCASVAPRTRWAYGNVSEARRRRKEAWKRELCRSCPGQPSAEHPALSTCSESSCFGPAWPEPERAISRSKGLQMAAEGQPGAACSEDPSPRSKEQTARSLCAFA